MPVVYAGFVTDENAPGFRHLVAHGPTLWVDIGFDESFDYQGLSAGTNNADPKSAVTKVPALVDTGAIESCIDDALAVQLNLPAVDKREISGVGGKTTCNMYLAHIFVPPLRFTQWGLFAGVHLTAGDQAHRALIGRTLSHRVRDGLRRRHRRRENLPLIISTFFSRQASGTHSPMRHVPRAYDGPAPIVT